MHFSRSGRFFPLLLATLLLSAPALTAPLQEDPEKKDGREAEEETVVITEDDLVQRYGVAEPSRDAGKTGVDRPASTEAKGPRKETGKTDSSVDRDRRATRIGEEIARLKKRIASLRNPYLPRVETTEKERERESGMDAAERVRDLQDRIDVLSRELSALRKVKPAHREGGR